MTIEWDHVVWALITGVTAGIAYLVGFYRKEKKQTEAIRRMERFLEWVMMVTLNLVEVHNEFHPEARVDTRSLSKLLHDATTRAWED